MGAQTVGLSSTAKPPALLVDSLLNLSPGSLKVQRIALFGGNVHILYGAKMVQDLMFLLLMANKWIFNVTGCNRNKI